MSVVKAGSCNLTKYVKVSTGKWRHCPVVKGSTGRVKPHHVLVGGGVEVHTEGYYSIEWYEGGKRHRVSAGKNAAYAQQAQEQQNLLLKARAHGIAVSEKAPDVSLADACAEFLEETRQQRTIKTVAQYTTALDYFQASCPLVSLHAIDRQDLMRFMAFLGGEKHLAPRTIWTKVAIVEGKLEAPKHLVRTVHDLYFEPKYEEFRWRTIWTLSNAFTSAFKELEPIPQFKATAKLGEFLEARFSQTFLRKHGGAGRTAAFVSPLPGRRRAEADASPTTDFPRTRLWPTSGFPTIRPKFARNGENDLGHAAISANLRKL